MRTGRSSTSRERTARGSREEPLSSRRSIRTAADKRSRPAVAGTVDGVTAGASFDLQRILSVLRPSSASLKSIFHGEDHWRHVASIGLDLAAGTPDSDPTVVVLLPLLHDAQRVGDHRDPGHAAPAGAHARPP